MCPNGVQKSRKDKLMEALMTWEQMKDRYQKGEDSFELTIEKWTRIKSFGRGYATQKYIASTSREFHIGARNV